MLTGRLDSKSGLSPLSRYAAHSRQNARNCHGFSASAHQSSGVTSAPLGSFTGRLASSGSAATAWIAASWSRTQSARAASDTLSLP